MSTTDHARRPRLQRQATVTPGATAPSEGGVAAGRLASDELDQGATSQASRSGEPLRWGDAQLLQALGTDGPVGIGELITALGVTATAVRQRVDRLLDAGLIVRRKVASGRGRPTFVYELTERGRWCAGADPTDLAEAMWHEILELSDGDLRAKLLGGVARRIGRRYAQRLEDHRPDGVPVLADQMRHLVDLFAQRRIETRVQLGSGKAASLPVLDVPACPYPALRTTTADRSMCRLETEMLSEALGHPIRLSSCVLDGDSVCRFVPESSTGDASTAASDAVAILSKGGSA